MDLMGKKKDSSSEILKGERKRKEIFEKGRKKTEFAERGYAGRKKSLSGKV